MPAELVLDAEHQYWLVDGDKAAWYCVGCTNTLKGVGLLDARFYNDEGQQRGSAAHRLIEARLNGASYAEVDGPAQSLSGYVQAALRYLDDSKAEVLNVEFSLADPDRMMAGTPDVIALVTPPYVGAEPRFAVIDWKTGQPEAWHGYQLAWYEHLARVNKIVEGLVDRIVVHLREDGTYTIRTCRERNDWRVADAARVVEQAKRAA